MSALIGRGASNGESASADARRVKRAAIVLPRFLRPLARLLSEPAMLEARFPRHCGSFGALGFLAATAIYGMIVGGHSSAVIGASSAAAGFAVDNVVVEGNSETSDIDVLQQLGLDGAVSVMTLDASQARGALIELPWVRDADVRKVYPDTLEISLTEREPFAIWQNGQDLFVIEKNGAVIAPMNERKFVELPFFVGLGADANAAGFARLMKDYPSLAGRVRAHVRVADRRWDLYLDNGVIVRLPATGERDALDDLARMQAERELLARDITVVDLRLADRMTVRLSPEALEKRQAAIEERAKALDAAGASI